MNEQAENLERVSIKLGRFVIEFCEQLIESGRTDFYAADLMKWIRARDPSTAPDSPGRILRLLRQRGKISYMVVSRRDSHYRLIDRGGMK